MLSVLIGAVLNICLDPLFIFVLHMGVRGGGSCNGSVTGGQCNMGGTFPGFGKKRDASSLKNMHLKKDVIKMIAGLGISPFIMQSTESLVTITAEYGTVRDMAVICMLDPCRSL